MKTYHVCETTEELKVLGAKLNKKFLVVFVTDHCFPCERQKDAITLSELKFEIDIVFINVTKNSDTASDFDVFSTPEIILLDQDCNVIKSIKGFTMPLKLVEILSPFFEKK